MRIEKIVVEGLFELYDHEIPLNLDDQVTILHGPNGVGKTTVLRMLHDLCTFGFDTFFRVPFGVFRLELESGGQIELRCPQRRTLDVFWRASATEEVATFQVARLSSESDRESQGPWLKLAHRGDIDVAEIRHYATLPASNSLFMWDERLEEWPPLERDAFHAAASCYAVLNIARLSDQRLVTLERILVKNPYHEGLEVLARKKASAATSVEACARSLAEQIGATTRDYGALSRQLDQTFPRRLLRGEGTSPTPEELPGLVDQIEARQRRLQQLSLLRVEPLEPLESRGVDPGRLAMLSIYLLDTLEKLKVFDGLAERLSLLRSILDRLFQNKRIVFSEHQGFTFEDLRGRSIPLEGLSSGEQHELVMLYHMLFRVAPGTLLLIDEPELSFHVAWQRDFLKDILAITRLRGFDVLMATHSPYIVADRWDLTVELSGKARDEAVA